MAEDQAPIRHPNHQGVGEVGQVQILENPAYFSRNNQVSRSNLQEKEEMKQLKGAGTEVFWDWDYGRGLKLV